MVINTHNRTLEYLGKIHDSQLENEFNYDYEEEFREPVPCRFEDKVHDMERTESQFLQKTKLTVKSRISKVVKIQTPKISQRDSESPSSEEEFSEQEAAPSVKVIPDKPGTAISYPSMD